VRSSETRLALAACAALLGAGAAAAQPATLPPACPAVGDWPQKLTIEYDVTASKGPFSLDGDSVLRFERSGASYTLGTDTTGAAGLYRAVQTSRGNIEEAGLRPLEYAETRSRRPTQTTTFDWKARQVHFTTAPDARETTRPGLQDRASLLLQITWLRRKSPAATNFDIPVAGARRVGDYHFVRHGTETVQLPIGDVEAIRLERPADEDNDRLEAWFAARWCGLPVRIKYTDRKGGVIDHRMRAMRFD